MGTLANSIEYWGTVNCMQIYQARCEFQVLTLDNEFENFVIYPNTFLFEIASYRDVYQQWIDILSQALDSKKYVIIVETPEDEDDPSWDTHSEVLGITVFQKGD